MLKILYILLLVSCANDPAPTPEPVMPTAEQWGLYHDAIARMETMLDHGQVVSRWDDDTTEHVGDSLIWTGMALGVVPCDDHIVEEALASMIYKERGFLVRFEPLPDQFKGGNEVSMDGALGLYWGLARRVKRCHNEGPWVDYIVKHYDAVKSENGYLYPGGGVLMPYFDFVLEAIGAHFGARDPVSTDHLQTLEIEAAGWASIAAASKSSCFRAHLGYLALSTLEELGHDVPRGTFCAATAGLNLPLVDHWCGREGLLGYIQDYQPNVWEYRHQRCPAWEDPDGKPGLMTPGIDYLVALTTYYSGLQ